MLELLSLADYDQRYARRLIVQYSVTEIIFASVTHAESLVLLRRVFLDSAPRWGVIMPISPKCAINLAMFTAVEQMLRCEETEVTARISAITDQALAIITRRSTDYNLYRIYNPHRPVPEQQYLYGLLGARYLHAIRGFPYVQDAHGFRIESVPLHPPQKERS
jgi:hypothetical protein